MSKRSLVSLLNQMVKNADSGEFLRSNELERVIQFELFVDPNAHCSSASEDDYFLWDCMLLTLAKDKEINNGTF